MAFPDLATLANAAHFVSALNGRKEWEINLITDPSVFAISATMDAFYKWYPVGLPGPNELKEKIRIHFKSDIDKFMLFDNDDKLLYRSPEHYIWKEIPVTFSFFHNCLMKDLSRLTLAEKVSPFSY